MKVILAIVAIYGIFVAIGVFFSWINKLNEKRKEKIRNRVLDDFQKDFEITPVIEKYKQKLKYINYKKSPTAIENYLNKYSLERNIKTIGEFGKYLGECPSCDNGKLIGKKGPHGSFIGCSKFPKCKYTENVKSAKAKYKANVEEQIINEIQKAYN